MDILDILFFVGIIGFTIVKLIFKKSNPTATTPGGMGEAWQDIEHAAPAPQAESPFLNFDLDVPEKPKKVRQKQSKKNIPEYKIPTHEKRMEVIDTTTEEEHHLLDEARKGIIWSEILQRKY